MAEWVGRRRSGPAQDAPETNPEDVQPSEAPLARHTPGAATSPQVPGQTPDRSSIPGHGRRRMPPPAGPIARPLSEYGTAQRIMRVYAASGEDALKLERFEQAPVADEEARKADPELLTPVRPAPGRVRALPGSEPTLGVGAGPAEGSATIGSEGAPIGESLTGGDAAATPVTGGIGTPPEGGLPTPPHQVVAEAAGGERSLDGAVPQEGAEGGADLGESTWAEGRADPDDLTGSGGESVSEQVVDSSGPDGSALPERPGSASNREGDGAPSPT